MTSGIYKLVFPDTQTYVGKSVNMPQRWDQHQQKLEKGTAAKNMMEARPRSGFKLDCSVLLPVHPDLLDPYENYYINTLSPQLNTQRPAARGDYSTLEAWANLGYQTKPVTFAMQLALDLTKQVNTLGVELEASRSELQEVQQRWDSKVYRTACANALFQTQTAQLRVARVELAALRQFKTRVDNCGWWERLWKQWS